VVAEAPPGPRRRQLELAPILLPMFSIGAVLALWELAPRLGWVSETSVPPGSEVLVEVGAVFRDPTFFPNLGSSAGRWATGFAIALAIGIPIGIVMGRSKVAFQMFDPILTMTYPVPKAALILIFVLWWGAGDLSRIMIIIMGSLIPIIISSYHGAAGLEPRLLWSARALGTGRAASMLRVVLPGSLPQILSGVRLTIAISIFTLLASELLIRQDGIGAYMFTNLDNGQFLRVWAVSVVIASIGFLLDLLYVLGVRRVLPWLEGDV